MKNEPFFDFLCVVMFKHLRQCVGWLILSRLLVLLVLLYSVAHIITVVLPELVHRLDSAAQEVEILLNAKSRKLAK